MLDRGFVGLKWRRLVYKTATESHKIGTQHNVHRTRSAVREAKLAEGNKSGACQLYEEVAVHESTKNSIPPITDRIFE